MTDWIARLCAEVGVHAQYRGFEGQTVAVSRETQRAVVQALGVDIHSDADARAWLHDRRAEEAKRPLPQDLIVEAGQPAHIPLGRDADWVLEAEGTGDILAEGAGGADLRLPALPLGIHRLRLRCGAFACDTFVLARPVRAVRLADRVAPPRIWGVLAALYGLTDGVAAQVGTYPNLGRYAAAMAAHGADFLGINPVHAMGQVRPGDLVSPYSPSHREFLNTWHCAGSVDRPGDAAPLVEYRAALRDGARALNDDFDAFRQRSDDAPDAQAFRSFAAQGGAALHAFAVYEALAARHGPDWRSWPAPYRHHDAQALGAFEAAHAVPIARTKWAQWQAAQQLGAAQSAAIAAGMRVGLFLDLAVGPRLGGAETWDPNTSLVTGATLGAPPDPLGPSGQSWGLAPLSPLTCRADGYAGFARLLRSTMRRAGMIRIDHIIGLMRSFWLPEGGTEGTYVSYPFDALLAVVAIESARNGTIVVGEDLGLVPEGLREKLAASGLYGLDVLQYMRTASGGFVDPAETRALAVCAFATHDTPTVAGFFSAEDAEVRHRLGGIDADALGGTRADRRRARRTLTTEDPVQEIHGNLARANAQMVAIQLDDIAGRVAQQNLPGTVDGYPNWRLKAPFTVQQIATSPEFAGLAATMRAQDRAHTEPTETEHGLQDC